LSEIIFLRRPLFGVFGRIYALNRSYVTYNVIWDVNGTKSANGISICDEENMNMLQIVSKIEQEWDRSSGFLGLLRTGVFDRYAFERLVQVLQSVELEDQTMINRRFVALVWCIPVFILGQREYVEEKGGMGTDVDEAYLKVLHLLDDILGRP
jgi:hypothetical protein